uniref:Membrane-associated tyrosine- and threonine-specific cdc2-inhibitory kinase n=1 Tax=Latimeria chalumnae TaxID=7897 RepID=H3AX30_LATCH
MPIPPDTIGESQLSRTPIPIPAFFQEAEQPFSLKKRGRSLCYTVPPRPPGKFGQSVSRIFPNRHESWSQPRPRSVSSKDPENNQLRSQLYDESKQELYFDQCFHKICKLGMGSFGEVYKVRNKEDGKLYAVKCSMEHFRGELDRHRKLQEAQKHERLEKHPNCVEFVQAWEERRKLYIQTELCCLNLQQYSEEAGPLPEAQVWGFLCDLLQGLKHLHDRGLVHMDVKPANIFISQQDTCKLGDFGLMLELDRGDLSEAQEGDPKYMAPELLDGEYTKAADVFSLGLTILEISCNMELPKGGEGWQQLRQRYLPLEFTAGLSTELVEVLKVMLEPNPRKRATVDQLLSLLVLRKVQRWRRVMLASRAGLSRVLSLFQLLICLLCSLWHRLCDPTLGFLRSRRAFTPSSPVPSSISSGCEDDSLGDEVFEMSPQSLTPIAMHRNYTYHGEQVSLCMLHSPDIDSRPSVGNTSTPRNVSPQFTGGSSSRSPDVSHISRVSPVSHNSSSPGTRLSSGFLGEDFECGQRSAFEPKNLLSMFEEVSLQ